LRANAGTSRWCKHPLILNKAAFLKRQRQSGTAGTEEYEQGTAKKNKKSTQTIVAGLRTTEERKSRSEGHGRTPDDAIYLSD
jgi:hypothetical protein